MSDMSVEERVRERAYQLWERDGSPEGHADEYWHQAWAEIMAQEDEPGAERPATDVGGANAPHMPE